MSIATFYTGGLARLNNKGQEIKMANTSKHLLIALVVSAMLVTLNIIAVTQSSGENYYRVIEQFISRYFILNR